MIPDRSLPFRFMLRLPGGRTATSFGVDVNSVTPDVISGKGDGICRDDEIAIACVDDGGVLANLRSSEQARIMLWQMPSQ